MIGSRFDKAHQNDITANNPHQKADGTIVTCFYLFTFKNRIKFKISRPPSITIGRHQRLSHRYRRSFSPPLERAAPPRCYTNIPAPYLSTLTTLGRSKISLKRLRRSRYSATVLPGIPAIMYAIKDAARMRRSKRFAQ